MDTDSNTAIGEFFQAWAIYQKVLANNYMYHREIYQEVALLLRQQFTTRPFSLLDLGCGDASFLAEALKDTAISHYTGYDLSAPALELANENIGQLGCRKELINADFMAGLARIDGKFDVIFTSFAVHHLAYLEKAEFFRLARRALTDKGFLLMIDTLRDPGQSLSDYLDAYCQWLETSWNRLDPQEISAACGHIRNNDQPETAETLIGLAQDAGFSLTRPVCAWTWHQALLFSA